MVFSLTFGLKAGAVQMSKTALRLRLQSQSHLWGVRFTSHPLFGASLFLLAKTSENDPVFPCGICVCVRDCAGAEGSVVVGCCALWNCRCIGAEGHHSIFSKIYFITLGCTLNGANSGPEPLLREHFRGVAALCVHTHTCAFLMTCFLGSHLHTKYFYRWVLMLLCHSSGAGKPSVWYYLDVIKDLAVLYKPSLWEMPFSFVGSCFSFWGPAKTLWGS